MLQSSKDERPWTGKRLSIPTEDLRGLPVGQVFGKVLAQG
jgi:hypothetical protein